MESNQSPQVVLFIVGTTAVGKSKLSLDLASQLRGEIVNADSMQVYAGNEGIMTAKPTPDEKQRIPHHLYDCVDLFVKDFNVNKYRTLSLDAIQGILARGHVPVVVGGTNYYIETLLFERGGISFEYEQDGFDKAFEWAKNHYPEEFRDIIEDFRTHIPPDDKQSLEDKYDSETLHRLLLLADPLMGEYLHSKDKRRIINALFKFFKFLPHQKHPSPLRESDIRMQVDKLRFLPIIIQMWASPPVLESRIRKRIDQMTSKEGRGLTEIFALFNQFEGVIDFEKGILQAIGYKEFYPLYECMTTKLDKDQAGRKVASADFSTDEEGVL